MPKKQPPRNRRRPPSITSITYWRKFATHRAIYIGLAGIIGLGIVAYFGTSPLAGGRTGRQEYLEDVVATVNNEPIRRADYEKVAERVRRSAGGSISMAVLQEGYLLSSLVDSALLRAEARRRGIRVSNDEVERAISEMRTLQRSGRTERLSDEDLLKMTGVETMSDLRETVARDLLPRKLGETLANAASLSFEDLARSYDEIRVRHILVAVAGTRAPAGKGLPEEQARRRAEEILKEIQKGGDFAALADRYSDDPSNKPADSKPKGGDLGWYKRGGGFDKTFEEAAFALKPGEVSGLVRTPFGFHIIKVDQTRRELPKDFEKNKAQLLETFRSQKVSEALSSFLEQARPKAKIVWKDPSLEWRYAYGRSNVMGGMSALSPSREESEARMVSMLRAYVPKHKTDSAAALILGQTLYRQLVVANLPPGPAGDKPPKVEKEKLRAEVIQCYETALEHAEDQDVRLTLARLYREAKQPAKALDQYRMMHRLLAWDDSGESRFVREQIEKGLRELGDTKLADEEAAKIAQIKAREDKERREAAERAKAEPAKGAQTGRSATSSTPVSPPTSATTGTVTVPVPSNEEGQKR